MKAIVAVDRKWGIGKKNDLLFSLPEDMKYFREKTAGKTVCMGYNTLLSFPNSKPLKNRVNIVLAPEGVTRDDCTVVYTLEQLSKELKKYNTEDVFVIGGAMFYRTMLPYCSEVLVTKVDADGGAEVFYENLDDLPNWSCVSEGEPIESNGLTIRFTIYKNSEIKEF
ncbi:MAG: dihydrofolate reductase [Clostridia bacterium]|jgi:dihydrofolate reductase|nr:dihydrofolate reductase [Clostridia bacterium]